MVWANAKQNLRNLKIQKERNALCAKNRYKGKEAGNSNPNLFTHHHKSTPVIGIWVFGFEFFLCF
jgi:hypothetical protein